MQHRSEEERADVPDAGCGKDEEKGTIDLRPTLHQPRERRKGRKGSTVGVRGRPNLQARHVGALSDVVYGKQAMVVDFF